MPDFKTIKQDEDGKYVWIYELNLFKNYVVFFSIVKIFFYITLGLWIFSALIDIGLVGSYLSNLWGTTKVMGLVFAILVGLLLIGYSVYGIIMGGRYCVMFEMDDEGVRHRQLEKQVRKAQAIGALAVLTGAASGNVGTMGTGILVASKSESYSEFCKVKKIKNLRLFNTIKVDALFNHNQVYVPKEDYDAVLEYIRERVPQKDKEIEK